MARKPDFPFPEFKVSKKLRRQIEPHGILRCNDPYHWQVLALDGRPMADWWPHKNKWRMAGVTRLGRPEAFVAALAQLPPPARGETHEPDREPRPPRADSAERPAPQDWSDADPPF